MASNLTLERADSLLSYDPESGVLRWNRSQGRGVKSGDIAGSVQKNGYRKIQVGWRKYCAHRIAWLLTNGEWPDEEIDHINGNKDDNRILNLRLATRAENNRNQRIRKDNTSGSKGVSWCRSKGRWVAYINKDKKRHYLGSFSSLEEASSRVDGVRNRFHKQFSKN